MRHVKWLLVVMLLALSSNVASAADWYFDGSAGDRDWGKAGNWGPGYSSIPGSGTSDRANTAAGAVTPYLVTGHNYSVGRVEVKSTQADGFEIAGGSLTVTNDMFIRQNGYLKLSSGTLSLNKTYANNQMYIGEGTGGTFEMTGGTLNTTRWVDLSGSYMTNNAKGTWLMKNGDANIGTDFILGGGWHSNPHGILDVTGGDITTNSDINLASNADATAEVYLQGGTLNVRDVLWGSGSITFDIAVGGTLIDRGDARGSAYLDLITYSVNKGDGLGTKSVVYDSDNNRTIITSIPEPATVSLLALGGLLVTLRRKHS